MVAVIFVSLTGVEAAPLGSLVVALCLELLTNEVRALNPSIHSSLHSFDLVIPTLLYILSPAKTSHFHSAPAVYKMASSSPSERDRPAQNPESVKQIEDSSARSESPLVGPKVISTEFYASTEPVPQRPFHYLPISKADATQWPNICIQTADLLKKWDFMCNSEMARVSSLD